MSTAVTSATPGSLTQAANATASGTAASTATGAGTASNPLTSLSGNFQTFLHLLMTQLQNQDPTSPLDTNQFTSQLVQFASVEQQINTNTSLTSLIQLTQSGEILQSSSMVGHQVAAKTDQMPLQNGKAELQFTATQAGPVAIAVYSSGGKQIADATVQATPGVNTWNWTGGTAIGGQAPDGAYKVAVVGTNASGATTALPFNVVGTATGVQSVNGTLQLEFGPESIDFSTVQSILN